MTSTDRAFVLHTRPFRESSRIASFFTRDAGVLSAVVRGARGRGKKGAAIQPFSLLQIGWTGRSDLKTLTGSEPVESRFLQGNALYVGLYLNELLVRLMHEHEPHRAVFDRYHYVVSRLAAGAEAEALLRVFEFGLLEDLGYGFIIDRDALSGEVVDPACDYSFDPEEGMTPAVSGREPCFPGSHLIAIAAGDFSDAAIRLSAKLLARQALAPHLGARPLMSRELFRGAVMESRH